MTPDEFNKVIQDYNNAPDDFAWDGSHPIFRLAQENDDLKLVIKQALDLPVWREDEIPVMLKGVLQKYN